MNAQNLIAHRGDNTNYPENSYAGLESALRADACFIEFDVQMNTSKSLVVIHDTDFKRTANNPAYLFDINDAEMSKISVHEPYTFSDKHKPTYVSTLEEIMELLARYPKAHAFIEVKRESIWQWGLETFMTPLLALLKKYESQSTIISFGLDALEYTKKYSKMDTGFVFYDYHSCNLDIAKALKPNYMIISHTILPKEKLWQGDWKWVVYSINNIPEAQEILNRKDVDIIETDDICLLLEK